MKDCMRKSNSKLYRRWQSMNARCFYSCFKGFENYGGRGISVCYEWSKDNPDGFRNFEKWMDENGYDETLPRGVQTIDRIDVDGNYDPSNCRLISNYEQQSNTRRNVSITHNGETHHVSEWARITGMNRAVLGKRIKRGLNPEEALFTPLKPTNRTYRIVVDGIEFDTLVELSNYLNVNPRALYYQVEKGRSIEEVVERMRNGK